MILTDQQQQQLRCATLSKESEKEEQLNCTALRYVYIAAVSSICISSTGQLHERSPNEIWRRAARDCWRRSRLSTWLRGGELSKKSVSKSMNWQISQPQKLQQHGKRYCHKYVHNQLQRAENGSANQQSLSAIQQAAAMTCKLRHKAVLRYWQLQE